MMQLFSIELSGYVCERTATMREVLTRIEESPHLFQIIISEEGRLLGTVTDGDIRRAMLQEIGLGRAGRVPHAGRPSCRFGRPR